MDHFNWTVQLKTSSQIFHLTHLTTPQDDAKHSDYLFPFCNRPEPYRFGSFFTFRHPPLAAQVAKHRKVHLFDIDVAATATRQGDR